MSKKELSEEIIHALLNRELSWQYYGGGMFRIYDSQGMGLFNITPSTSLSTLIETLDYGQRQHMRGYDVGRQSLRSEMRDLLGIES